MPTPKKGHRLAGNPHHQRHLMANLAASLFEAGAITTTVAKAKHGGVHQQRQVVAIIHDQAVAHKLFAEIAPAYEDRNGGYLRILKLGPRPGDNAPMARIELV
jgi:large subunit ribosomal protein L17